MKNFLKSLLNKSNENIGEEIKGGAIKAQRLEPSEEAKIERMREQMKSPLRKQIDSDFLNELSDRLYGPQSEEYMEAIMELNDRFAKRICKSGQELLELELVSKVRSKESEINSSIS